MKWNYIPLLHRCENCAITFAPIFITFIFFHFYPPLLLMWELLRLGILGTDALKLKSVTVLQYDLFNLLNLIVCLT